MTPKTQPRAIALLRDMSIGVMAALGQAPIGAWPIALIGFGLLLWTIARAPSPRRAFWRGLRIGAGYFAFSLSWIVQPFFVDPWRHGWMAPFALLAIAFGLALFWAAAGALGRAIGGRLAPIWIALALAALELARGHVLTGFPWALPSHIWIDTWLAQMAALVGPNGMTALMLLALAAPLVARWGAGVTLSIAAISLGWSWHRLSLPEPEPSAGIVRLVQPNITQNLKWDRDEAEKNFDKLTSLSQNAKADLIVWPETAVPWLVEEGGALAYLLGNLGQGVPLATGLQRDEGALAWNSLAVLDAQGRFAQVFDKNHLVPFGEYIPMGDVLYDWFGLQAFASQAGAGYSAGAIRQLMDFGPKLGQALPLICYEAIFPEELSLAQGGDWLLQVTNDAWFGTLTGPYQHFNQTRLRAIENGLPLLRAANTGITAFVDARGRVVESLPLGVEGVIDRAVPGALGGTPYGRLGDWPLAAILTILLAGAALVRFGRVEQDRGQA